MMRKSIMLGLVLVAGTLHGLTLDKVDLKIEGTSIITKGNTASIKKEESCFLVKARQINPILMQIIEASGGKPTDIIVCKSDTETKIITHFSTVKVDSSLVPKRVYKDCIGFIANRDGTEDYFCNGSSCHVLGAEVFTGANTVGIAENDVCYFEQNSNTIRCLSGKVFVRPGQRESSATGTPGFIGSQSYIGTIHTDRGPQDMMITGGGKRTDFFKRDEPEGKPKV